MEQLKNHKFIAKYKKLSENPWTDHVLYFAYFLKKYRVQSLLELGLGRGSEVFIDYCQKVTSVEIVVERENLDWFNFCKKEFSLATNWNPLKYECDKVLLQAHSIAWRSHNPIDYLKDYSARLDQMIEEIFAKKSYDLIFVDCGFAPRADIINKLFFKTPIIVAHDTNCDFKMYGWNRVLVPESYTIIHLSTSQGLTFWVEKSHNDVKEILFNLKNVVL